MPAASVQISTVCRIFWQHGWGFAERTSRSVSQAGKGDIAHGPAGCHVEQDKRTVESAHSA
jgi:hypothetical protein